jgi:hypothetical protein
VGEAMIGIYWIRMWYVSVMALIWYEVYKMREALNTADRKVNVKGKEVLSRAIHGSIMGNGALELMYDSERVNLRTRLQSVVLENLGHLDA